MVKDVPRGYRRDLALETEVRDLYLALTGQPCQVEVYLSSRMGGHTAGSYRRLGGRHLLVFSSRYRALAAPAVFADLVRHELAHYHLYVTGHPSAGHGPLFHQMMRRWDFRRYADEAVMKAIARERPRARLRHLYLCPQGHGHWFGRHPRRLYSCSTCSPRFDPAHLLVYSGRSESR